jgi:hypothetical protein
MVVLKVFFTGAITAMLGLLFFSLFGWVDMDLVYVNPTYLTSAIIGGVIMGVGFIMGGYCPGTSFCGASIGKIDALLFIVDCLLACRFRCRIQLVGRIVPGKIPGPPKVSESLGLSDGVFALLLIVVALGCSGCRMGGKKFPRQVLVFVVTSKYLVL